MTDEPAIYNSETRDVLALVRQAVELMRDAPDLVQLKYTTRRAADKYRPETSTEVRIKR